MHGLTIDNIYFIYYNIFMQILNNQDYLQEYPKRLQQACYGVFGIFKDKEDNSLSI